jgi:hypothetical protein
MLAVVIGAIALPLMDLAMTTERQYVPQTPKCKGAPALSVILRRWIAGGRLYGQSRRLGFDQYTPASPSTDDGGSGFGCGGVNGRDDPSAATDMTRVREIRCRGWASSAAGSDDAGSTSTGSDGGAIAVSSSVGARSCLTSVSLARCTARPSTTNSPSGMLTMETFMVVGPRGASHGGRCSFARKCSSGGLTITLRLFQ